MLASAQMVRCCCGARAPVQGMAGGARSRPRLSKLTVSFRLKALTHHVVEESYPIRLPFSVTVGARALAGVTGCDGAQYDSPPHDCEALTLPLTMSTLTVSSTPMPASSLHGSDIKHQARQDEPAKADWAPIYCGAIVSALLLPIAVYALSATTAAELNRWAGFVESVQADSDNVVGRLQEASFNGTALLEAACERFAGLDASSLRGAASSLQSLAQVSAVLVPGLVHYMLGIWWLAIGMGSCLTTSLMSCCRQKPDGPADSDQT